MLRVEVIFNDDTTRTIERVTNVINKGECIAVLTEYSDILFPVRNFKSLDTEEVAGEGLVQ